MNPKMSFEAASIIVSGNPSDYVEVYVDLDANTPLCALASVHTFIGAYVSAEHTISDMKLSEDGKTFSLSFEVDDLKNFEKFCIAVKNSLPPEYLYGVRLMEESLIDKKQSLIEALNTIIKHEASPMSDELKAMTIFQRRLVGNKEVQLGRREDFDQFMDEIGGGSDSQTDKPAPSQP